MPISLLSRCEFRSRSLPEYQCSSLPKGNDAIGIGINRRIRLEQLGVVLGRHVFREDDVFDSYGKTMEWPALIQWYVV